jgi:hypothetical protein
VRTAFVLGFFDKVYVELREEFAAQLDNRQVVWVGLERYDPRKPFNVREFAGAFNRTVADGSTDEILIVLADMVPWATAAVEGMVASHVGLARTIRVKKFRDARSAGLIAELIRELGLDATPTDIEVVSEASLIAFLKGHRILCVRGNHQPGFDVIFRRASFADECFKNHCAERVYDVEKNSNLIRDLRDSAAHYGCVLYAWHGLRTAPKELKTKYPKGRFFEDSTPSRVLIAFRRAVTGRADGAR